MTHDRVQGRDAIRNSAGTAQNAPSRKNQQSGWLRIPPEKERENSSAAQATARALLFLAGMALLARYWNSAELEECQNYTDHRRLVNGLKR